MSRELYFAEKKNSQKKKIISVPHYQNGSDFDYLQHYVTNVLLMKSVTIA